MAAAVGSVEKLNRLINNIQKEKGKKYHINLIWKEAVEKFMSEKGYVREGDIYLSIKE